MAKPFAMLSVSEASSSRNNSPLASDETLRLDSEWRTDSACQAILIENAVVLSILLVFGRLLRRLGLRIGVVLGVFRRAT
jgi:hypothetical protein